MKKTLLTLFTILMLSGFCVKADEDFSYKFEKVTDYELLMTTYDPDTTASALIIYDNIEMEYNYDPGISDIVLTSLRTTKIKILKEDGISFAASV